LVLFVPDLSQPAFVDRIEVWGIIVAHRSWSKGKLLFKGFDLVPAVVAIRLHTVLEVVRNASMLKLRSMGRFMNEAACLSGDDLEHDDTFLPCSARTAVGISEFSRVGTVRQCILLIGIVPDADHPAYRPVQPLVGFLQEFPSRVRLGER
jgi:hypothetical protein